MINPMELSNRRYIVTGASSGLGRQVCITISQLGASVTAIARREDALRQTLSMMAPGEHDFYSYDLTQVEGIEELVTRIVAKNGKYDGMVHSAGIGTLLPAALSKYAAIKEIMDVNFFSFIEMARVLAKKKNSQDGASFVAISSAASKLTDQCRLAYTSSKSALDGAVRALAVEFGMSRKMRFNTVNPGWVHTELYEDFIEKVGREKAERNVSTHVLGIAQPVEVANVIAFLLSDAASKITGQNLFIDSGWTVNGYIK